MSKKNNVALPLTVQGTEYIPFVLVSFITVCPKEVVFTIKSKIKNVNCFIVSVCVIGVPNNCTQRQSVKKLSTAVIKNTKNQATNKK